MLLDALFEFLPSVYENGRMQRMKICTIRDESELKSIAETVLGSLTRGETAGVLALTGDLGVGKTALVKAIARRLSITEHITSPTFVIMKSYPITGHPYLKTLTHIDAYRIDTEDEMRVLGLAALMQDYERLICIEWPERIQGLIPQSAHTISLTIEKGGERTITYGN